MAQVIYETCSALDLVAMVFDPEERIRELERQLTKYERRDDDDKDPDLH